MKYILLMLCVVLAFAGDSFAITDEEIFRNFQFSFVNPGARSGAMGGAFIGLADDATAAEANPAGLTILTKPEVSFEYRHTEFDADRLNSFSSVGDATVGLSVVSDNTLEELNQPSFLSVVYPIGRTTIAFSRQELTKTEGGLDELVFLTNGPTNLLFGVTAGQDQSIVNYNFSFGTKLSEGFSIGATARYSTLDWQASVQNVLIQGGQEFLLFETNLDDDDSAFAWNVGALYSTTYVSIGAVFKGNPKFEVEETESGPGSLKPGTFTNVLNVPDTFGMGISVKPNDKITFVADVVRVQYSDLVEDIEAGRNLLTAGFDSSDIIYNIDDAWDYNVGTEFVVFIGTVPAALRVGYYRRSSSSMLVESTPGLGPGGAAVLNSLFVEREDENHFTFGNGFVFGAHFQVDWAVDLANLQDSFILSTVVRF